MGTTKAEFKVCHECKSDDIPVQAARCMHCGANLKPFYNKNIGWYLIGIGFLLAGFVFWPSGLLRSYALFSAYSATVDAGDLVLDRVAKSGQALGAWSTLNKPR